MKTTVTPCSDFAAYSGAWDRLAAAGYGVPILSSAFVESCLEHFADGSINLAVVEDEQGIIALVFLKAHRLGVLETWNPGQAPLGLFVFEQDRELTDIFDALFSHFRGRAMVSVTQQDSRFVKSSQFPACADLVPYIETPWIECAAPFEEYWNSLGKNIKRNMRKDSNKLESRNISTRLNIIIERAEMGAAIDAHGKLESSGWKGAANSAIAGDNIQGRFYTTLLQRFSKNKNGLVFQYYYGDELVASDFAVSNGKSVVILKTAYLQSKRETSPAQLLRHAYFPFLFERFAGSRIEFYGKALEWHSRWTKQTRPLYHMNVYRSIMARSVVRSMRRVARSSFTK